MSELAIEVYDDIEHRCKVYKLVIPYESLVTAPLTEFDRLQLESELSSDTPVADSLLDLQTIVLRIEQHNSKLAHSSTNKRKG